MSARTITTNVVELEEIIEMPGNNTEDDDDDTSSHMIEDHMTENMAESGNDTIVTEDLPPSNNPLQCRYCNKIFTRSFYRKEHERIHTGERPYSCSFCSKRFNSHGSCRKHERTHMNAISKKLDCDHCGRKFNDVNSLKIHSRTHSGEKPYSCHICGRSFGFDTVLKKHMLFHAGNKPFQCTVCQKSYFTAYDLRVHIRGHTGERPYKCRHCNLSFVTGRRRNIHEKTHQRKNTFECKKCGRVFRTSNALSLHHIKSQMMGNCDAGDPEVVYDNNETVVYQNGTTDATMLDGNILYHNNAQIGSPEEKESDNAEIDISALAQTVDDNLARMSSNIITPDVFPTALIRSTEHGIKPEPIQTFNIQNNQASPCPNDIQESNFSQRNSFPMNTESGNQYDASYPLDSRNEIQPETGSNGCAQLSVVTCDNKSSQTDAMKDVDLMFSEMAAARTIHECKSCGIIYRDYTMFLVHKTLHINPHKPFMCHLCGQESHDRVEFHSHMIWHMK